MRLKNDKIFIGTMCALLGSGFGLALPHLGIVAAETGVFLGLTAVVITQVCVLLAFGRQQAHIDEYEELKDRVLSLEVRISTPSASE